MIISSIKRMTFRLSHRAVVGVAENAQPQRLAARFGGGSYRIPYSHTVCGRGGRQERSQL